MPLKTRPSASLYCGSVKLEIVTPGNFLDTPVIVLSSCKPIFETSLKLEELVFLFIISKGIFGATGGVGG